MAFIEIQRRCQECEKSRELLREVQADWQQLRLDYDNLYEKVRTNLAKLSKRAQAAAPESSESADLGGNGDPLAKYRAALIQRKLGV